ncbi:MAG: amidohydrolase family protein, partial [Bacteroidales bacterium]|nr:amidohydrolase family protein [Bacteroidales bacterium]
DGHAPGLTGDALQQYAQTGITTDHECTTLKEAEEKIRAGMKILIREGSAAKDFENLHPLINKYPDMVMLCADDLHPDDLLRGHINTLVARGIAKGLDLFSLLRAATLNPVRHYQINLGLLQVGDSADFIVVDDLKKFAIRQSFLQGVEVFNDDKNRGGVSSKSPVLSSYPNSFNASKITASDIEVIATSEQMKVIQAIDGELLTKQLLCPVTKGLPVVPNTETDILKIVVLNRYGLAKPAVGFIHGFGLKQGALVSTVAHDSHHIVAVGCDDAALVEAINHVIDLKGGLVAYSDGMMTDLQLDIAGLMSSASGEEVARAYENLNKAASRMGSTLHAPFMTLAFMALLVIPELKLGDKGLFDVQQFGWTELFS